MENWTHKDIIEKATVSKVEFVPFTHGPIHKSRGKAIWETISKPTISGMHQRRAWSPLLKVEGGSEGGGIWAQLEEGVRNSRRWV